MKLATIHLNGIRLDAYYQITITQDPLGTGNSPTEYDVELLEISTFSDVQNLIELIHEYWLEKAREQIVEIERGF